MCVSHRSPARVALCRPASSPDCWHPRHGHQRFAEQSWSICPLLPLPHDGARSFFLSRYRTLPAGSFHRQATSTLERCAWRYQHDRFLEIGMRHRWRSAAAKKEFSCCLFLPVDLPSKGNAKRTAHPTDRIGIEGEGESAAEGRVIISGEVSDSIRDRFRELVRGASVSKWQSRRPPQGPSSP